MRSQKTRTDTIVKLPPQVMVILAKYKKNKNCLLPTVSLCRFNKNIKKIAETAGWTYPVNNTRTQKGINRARTSFPAKNFRFCDVISSHTMRRTSITTMLTSGMPELIVRKISGHTHDSKAFFRYVNLAQSLMDIEIEKMHKHFEIPPTIIPN